MDDSSLAGVERLDGRVPVAHVSRYSCNFSSVADEPPTRPVPKAHILGRIPREVPASSKARFRVEKFSSANELDVSPFPDNRMACEEDKSNGSQVFSSERCEFHEETEPHYGIFSSQLRLEDMMQRISQSQVSLANMVFDVQQDVKGIFSCLQTDHQAMTKRGRVSLSNSRRSRANELPFGGLFQETSVSSVSMRARHEPSLSTNSRHGTLPPPTMSHGELVGTASQSANPTILAPSLPPGWPSALRMRDEISGRAEQTMGTKELDATVKFSGQRQYMQSLSVQTGTRSFLMHPNSTKRLIFDLCSLAILLYDLTMIPFVVAWDLDLEGFVAWSSYITACFWSIDLGMNFITGYQRDGEVEMRPHMVARQYIRHSFLPDFMILICDWASIMISTQTSSNDTGSGDAAQRLRMLRFAKMSKLIRVAGLLRLVRLLRIVEDFVDRSVSEVYRMMLTVVGLFFFVLWLNHLLCCGWFWIGLNAPTDTGSRWIDEGDVLYGDRSSLTSASSSFQYLTSFHWSMVQLTLGSMEVTATNTVERCYSIVLLLFGLLFSSTLVSSLSATMIDFQMRMNTTYHRVRMLRNYLHQNKVDGNLSHRVMQQAEKRVASKEKLIEEDVSMLQSLSVSLRAELRFFIFKPHLLRHPLFRLWVNLSPATARHLCYDDSGAVEFTFLQPLDDLFVAGETIDTAYFLISGALWYTQEPEFSAVEDKSQMLVKEHTWLCEAALWASWICVGSTEAERMCEVLQIRAEGVFLAMQKHQLINEITVGYGTHFFSRIVTAAPPTCQYPTDLEVPFTDFGEIVASMDHSLQMVIARDALQGQRGVQPHLDSLSKFPYAREQVQLDLVAHRLGRKRNQEVSAFTLEKEVSKGEATIVLNGDGEVQRVVSLVAFDITNEDTPGEIFVQLGKYEEGSLVADCTLPGARIKLGETPLAAANRIMETRLHEAHESITMERLQRETDSAKDSGVDWLRKLYLRTVAHAIMCGPILAPTVRVQRSEAHFPMKEAYVFHNPQGKIVLYGWVQRSQFQFFKTYEGENSLSSWLSSLEMDEGGRETLGHTLVLRF